LAAFVEAAEQVPVEQVPDALAAGGTDLRAHPYRIRRALLLQPLDFEVSLSVADTWVLLQDLPRIAPCLPGAHPDDVIDVSTAADSPPRSAPSTRGTPAKLGPLVPHQPGRDQVRPRRRPVAGQRDAGRPLMPKDEPQPVEHRRPGTADAEAALGMAVLAAGAHDGDIAGAAKRLVRLHRTLEPDPTRTAGLAPAHCAFVDALEQRGWLDPQLAAHARARTERNDA